MPKQSFSSTSSNEPGKRPGPRRTYRVIQKPAKPGTVPEELVREAVRAVMQLRTHGTRS